MLLEHERNYGLGMDAAGPQERTKWEDRKRDVPGDYIELKAGCKWARSRVRIVSISQEEV